jgi:putative membrane protein
MSQDDASSLPGTGSRGLAVALIAIAATGIGWASFSTWEDIRAVGASVIDALWVVPPIVAVHLVQLLLSSAAWRALFPAPRPGWSAYFRLRLIREGIDSLFPVAQVGGEVVAAGMLTHPRFANGLSIAPSHAAAGVVVDVTLEVLSQAVFLLAGLGALTILAGGGQSLAWVGTTLVALFAAGGFLLAQRLGLLRLLEMLFQRVASQFPILTGMSLAGLHDAAQSFYRRRRALAKAVSLHFLSWSLGACETWIVLGALGAPASLAQAFVVESLGMAARSAGFAIPGALAVQEGGFVVAAISVGLPDSAGLALSLVKRVREVLVGIAGVALARWSGGIK